MGVVILISSHPDVRNTAELKKPALRNFLRLKEFKDQPLYQAAALLLPCFPITFSSSHSAKPVFISVSDIWK